MQTWGQMQVPNKMWISSHAWGARSQEIIDLNREIAISKEDISQIRTENLLKVNTLSKVHFRVIEDMKKENKNHLVKLTELRRENIKLKQSLHAFKEFCDTTLALMDEAIKNAIIVNKENFN